MKATRLNVVRRTLILLALLGAPTLAAPSVRADEPAAPPAQDASASTAPEQTAEPALDAAAPSEPASSESGDDVDPRALAAIDLYSTGDVDGAYRLFKELYEANQDSDPPGVLLALLHSNAGKFLEMRRALEQTAEDYPTDPEAYLQLAGIDTQEGRFLESDLLIERAERLVDEYPKRMPDSVSRLAYLKEETLNARANLAERRGRYDAARSFVEKAIALNPENPQTRWNLGYLSMKTRDYDAAEAAFDEARKLNPELWPGWLQVASSLDKLDEIDEAKARIAACGVNFADEPKAERAQLARLYMRWYMLDEALEIVKAFEEDADPKDVERWILTGWLALYANEYARAEELFRNATLIDPTNFEASNGFALALLDQGNKDKIGRARTIAARNYRARPESDEAATTYAWTLFLSGSSQDADAIFQPMMESGSLSATASYYIAEIANQRGDHGLAITLLRLSLSQKANFPKRAAANELLAILEADQAETETEADADSNAEVETDSESTESTDEWNDDEE